MEAKAREARAEGHFWSHVIKREDDCWDWGPGAPRDKDNRPRFRRNSVARWAYDHFIGPIPKGKEAGHTCMKYDCVNYSHIKPMTHVENMSMPDISHWWRHTTGNKHVI